MNKPLISVVVPVYNVEKYIDRCVSSILNQTFSDFELILIDDGSPDDCGKICDNYANSDSRITIIHKANGGVSSARNIGIEKACGKYITFIDSDDFIEPDCLLKLSVYTDKNTDLIIGGIYYYNPDTNEKNKQEGTESGIFNKSDYKNNIAQWLKSKRLNYLHAKLYKKAVIDENNIRFDEKTALGEDTIFNFDFLLFSQNVAIEESCLYDYMLSPVHSTLSGRFYENRFEKFEVISSHIYDVSERLGCLTIPMKSEINSRIISAAEWTFENTILADISLKKKKKIIKEILISENLVKALEDEKKSFDGELYNLMRKQKTSLILEYHYNVYFGKGIKGKIKRIIKGNKI